MVFSASLILLEEQDKSFEITDQQIVYLWFQFLDQLYLQLLTLKHSPYFFFLEQKRMENSIPYITQMECET